MLKDAKLDALTKGIKMQYKDEVKAVKKYSALGYLASSLGLRGLADSLYNIHLDEVKHRDTLEDIMRWVHD